MSVIKFSKNEQLILSLMKEYAFKVIQPPKHKFKYYSVEPGLAYSNTQWDWDAYWALIALNDTCELLKGDATFDYEARKQEVKLASKGDVLNFLDFQEEDGFIPIMLRTDVYNDNYSTRPNVLNANKGCICKTALLACELNNDYSWLDVSKLDKYMSYMRNNQFDEKSGLYFWRDDVMIGIDNNPTVFGREEDSTADIYLNSIMVNEFDCLIKIKNALNIDSTESVKRRNELVNAIRTEMWDETDGLFYSQDINVKTRQKGVFHTGLGVFWKTLPIKIEFWGCYLPLLFNFATEEQANKMIKRLYSGGSICKYGIRTLSKNEKMYSLEPSGNPSNWLGAVWLIGNYAIYKGLLNYGKKRKAKNMYKRTFKLLANGIKRDGSMCESYNPDTGEGILHRMFFSWNMLICSMMKEDKKIK